MLTRGVDTCRKRVSGRSHHASKNLKSSEAPGRQEQQGKVLPAPLLRICSLQNVREYIYGISSHQLLGSLLEWLQKTKGGPLGFRQRESDRRADFPFLLDM